MNVPCQIPSDDSYRMVRMKLGRNDPCSCGSGKKYKNCCLGKTEFHPPHPSAPTPGEINLLDEMFIAGRFAELEKFAHSLLKPYSDSGIVWKLYGLSLQMQGKDALFALRKAAEFLPNDAEAHGNLAAVLRACGQLDAAVASCRRALLIRPDFAEVHNNMGVALKELGQLEAALANYRKAVELKPNFAEAHNNLGILLFELGQFDGAAASYRRVLQIKPNFDFAIGMYLHSKMQCCDWEGIDEASHEILRGINEGKAVSEPFVMLAIPSMPAQQKQCAEIYIREKYPEGKTSSGKMVKYSHDKIRLGYFSSDFYNHATAHLIAELFERHDRSRFEVIGLSFGASPNDDMRQRLSSSFDRFLNIRNQSDQNIVNLTKSLEIDIAIDLKGFTTNARTGIFALHPAPIQVSYLGYPGTMGAPYIDYLIADPTIVPAEHRQFYSEKIAYLPNTYQVNDSHRKISERQFTRSEAGLPEDGFVFCCFNNNYKITPAIFDIWMQLLNEVEGSVLWLLENNTHARKNLQNEAARREIATERIIFAKRMDLPDHLARHRLADLFLDTFFYNAHTTASDALWAGLPVLTYLGDTFAGRVAASLLNAIGLPELITHSHEEYKALALELARNPARLSAIKQQLARNITTHPLFDTKLFTRNIEDAFIHMWERNQQNFPPKHIYVGQIDK